jgi:NlpE N-terminal domain
MARLKVLMAAALLVGGATACSDVTGNNARADGVYFLQTVNQNPVPYSYTDNTTGHTLTVMSDDYSLNSNGTYSDQQTYTDNGANSSYTESGTWTQSNNVVSFYPSQSSTGNLTLYQGTLNNSNVFGGTRTLSINFSGTIWLYSE